MSRTIIRSTFILLFISAASVCHSATIHVKLDGSGDYYRINDAISFATAGDTVLVWPGCYEDILSEEIIIPIPIHLISHDGPLVTIIDNSMGIEIWIVKDECSVIGFTIIGGGGIQVGNSRALIKNNIIKNYTGPHGNAIVVLGHPSPTIEYNIIRENSAFNGSAITVQSSSPVIRFNTIINNTSFEYGGGQIAVFGESSYPVISNNIISRNVISFGGGSGIFCNGDCPPGNLTVTCNNLWNNTPTGNYVGIPDLTGIDGNISNDPLFCGAIGSGNYYLQAVSPCAAQNVPAPCNNERMGCHPVGCEVGTGDESWGKIKSLLKK